MCNYTRRHQPPVHDRFSLLKFCLRIAAIDAGGQSLAAELMSVRARRCSSSFVSGDSRSQGTAAKARESLCASKRRGVSAVEPTPVPLAAVSNQQNLPSLLAMHLPAGLTSFTSHPQ